MTTEERLTSLERSLTFYKRITLAVLLVGGCLIAAGQTAEQKPGDIKVKSITFVSPEQQEIAVIQKSKVSDMVCIKHPDGGEAEIGLLVNKESSGVYLFGPDKMLVSTTCHKNRGRLAISDQKTLPSERAVVFGGRLSEKQKISSYMILHDRNGDKAWVEFGR